MIHWGHCVAGARSRPGLREIAGTPELDRLAAVFCAATGKEESSRARRIKAHARTTPSGVITQLVLTGDRRAIEKAHVA